MEGVLQIHVKIGRPTSDPVCVAATPLVDTGRLLFGESVKMNVCTFLKRYN